MYKYLFPAINISVDGCLIMPCAFVYPENMSRMWLLTHAHWELQIGLIIITDTIKPEQVLSANILKGLIINKK